MIYCYEILSGPRSGEVIDLEHKASAPPFGEHEVDGCVVQVKRVIGNTNFILKGGCWHRDGYSAGVQNMPTKEERANLGKPK